MLPASPTELNVTWDPPSVGGVDYYHYQKDSDAVMNLNSATRNVMYISHRSFCRMSVRR